MLHLLPYTHQRVTLRALRRDDLPAFHAYRSREDVARFQGWSPMSSEQAADFLRSQAAHTRLIPGNWHQIGIALADHDGLIGDMGVWLSDDQSQAEFGLSIDPSAQGRGYGAEAIQGLLRLLFLASAITEVIAKADIFNAPCLAVLARAGMHHKSTHISEYKGTQCTEQLFSITRADSPIFDRNTP